MKKDLKDLYEQLKKKGLTPAQQRVIELELRLAAEDLNSSFGSCPHSKRISDYNDLQYLQDMVMMNLAMSTTHSIDDLIARDTQREKDGFPRKIRIGKMIKPSQDGDDKVVIVPTTVEEKLLHDQVRVNEEEGEDAGGSGDGEEGEVIGEEPVREGQGGEGGAGQGEGGSHEVESNAYDMGRILTEQFQLPNLKDKGKKRSLSRYTYDLTDRNRGFGQIIDKKATLRRLLQTNIALGRVKAGQKINPDELLISPADRVYRILSREKDYESQAVVFFVRDYSGSMHGKPTELVVTQHVLIYSWLTYQYERQVETRFILHDTEAKEVEDFHTYYNLRVAGGTQVSSAYKLVNSIVKEENLERDYNIYIFHGTDGDDWDTSGKEAIPELEQMLGYANRVGITVAENGFGISGSTEVEKYLKKSGLLEEKKDLLRLDVMKKDSDEPRLIEGIKKLIS
jgi:uncharacterized sporulation protein YeaH/YhbH (DUF444 family)